MRIAVVCAVAVVGSAAGQTSYPMITHVTPVAVQRGQTVEVLVEGQQNFAGAYKVLVEGTGVKAEVVGATPVGETATPVRGVKVKLTVEKDAAPGVREFRIATSLGVSSVGQLLVSEHKVAVETSDNNTSAKATPLPVPGVAAGKVEIAEDVDVYKFRAAVGQTMTFEVLCARLQDKIHDLQKHADPILTLFDANGRELAANDDFYFADPLLVYTFTKEGEYFVQVRDVKYDGDPRWVYALLATDLPHVSHVYPMAGNPGARVEVEPVGSARKLRERFLLSVPKESGLHTVPLDLGGTFTNAVPFLVSPLPQALEQEPNDAADKATRVTLPCGINGRIDKPRDLDHFVFASTKGKSLRFEVKARRFGTPLVSSLDSVLDVLSPKGQVLATNDDTIGKDAALVFTPPADGDYVLRVRDLNSKGGPTAVYHVEAELARPDFTLRCDCDKAMIAPGARTPWYVHVVRANGFAGPVKVEVKGLPAGVTASPLTIPPTMTQGLVILAAADDAKVDAANVEVIGTATASVDGKEETLSRRATPNQEIYLPGGGRGRFDVSMHTVAVSQPSDLFTVKVSAKEIKLKPGGEAKIDVEIVRKPGYDKPVTLDVLLRHLNTVYGNPLPPGVTVVENKSKTLLGGGSKGHVVLKAAPDAAPIDGVPLSVLAHVSVNFVVKMSHSSEPILLSIAR